MRNKFVYSCSVKNLCLGILWSLGKYFLPPTGCGSIFAAKSCQDSWRSDWWLMRGQVNMANESKLSSRICSTFKALVGCVTCHWLLLWRRIGPFLLTNAGYSSYSFWCISSVGSAYFSDVMVSQDSESCSGSDGQQTTRQWLWLFLVQVWLWGVLWSFSGSNNWAGPCQLSYRIHFSPHIRIQSHNGSLLHRIREDDIQNDVLVNSQGAHLWSFFTFPVCFKCWMTIE